jgi:hypothetical protein
VGLRAIGEFHRSQRRLHFFFAEQRVIAKCVVPLFEISEIRIDAAISLRCGSRALVGFLKRAGIFFSCVAVGAVCDFVLSLDVEQSAIHVQRRKDALKQEFTERLSGDFSDNQAQQHISRIAVGPACTWREKSF